ncbi:MAG: hypothetical protein NTZ74_01695 [Chloroflexi bacterium]|nr:hypothetical protein [Chloroflexota bacterium]
MKRVQRFAIHHWKKALYAAAAVLFALTGVFSVFADYGHTVVSYFSNPAAITFPRAGRIVLWNKINSTLPGFFARYYFIRSGCKVGQNCLFVDVSSSSPLLTPLIVAAGETWQIKGCDCYGGDCGVGGCATPQVGSKAPYSNYFCPNYFYSKVYNPAQGGTDFTDLAAAFLASGNTQVGSTQCWGDWDEQGVNGKYDHDFDDFVLLWAYRDTFSGVDELLSGTVAREQCFAKGWVAQNELPALDLNYRVLLDGVQVAAGSANQSRTDLSAVCTAGSCAFSVDLWGFLSPFTWHTVRVQAQNPYTSAWFDLSNTNRTLRCGQPVTLDLKGEGSEGPLSLPAGSGMTLSWNSENAETCTASGSWSGGKGLTGSQELGLLAVGTFTYTLSCSNPLGALADSVTVLVFDPPQVDLRVNGVRGPLTLASPASFTLSWTSQAADHCSGGGSWSGDLALQGDRSFSGVADEENIYSITCSNPYAFSESSVEVRVPLSFQGTISAKYARLLLFGPQLGLPAQVLSGSVSGGVPPYSVRVEVRSPSGGIYPFSRDSTPWSVTPENSGDENFGTTEEGSWTAWATLQDSAGHFYETGGAVWEVVWHPVHALP